jgi:DNA polymerase-3 subunit delta'
MNFPEPHRNPHLMGHDQALDEIASAFKSGRMPQAWLICGAEGIGKATLAYHAANFVLSGGQNKLGNLNPDHPVARLIASEAHPDLFVLKRGIDDKTGLAELSISAENARKISPFLHRTATQGEWRVAIIDEAQCLNRYGQNAILKIIEEPPPRCLVLICTTTPGALLPTIRSRCRLLNLNPLAEGPLRALLSRFDAEGSIEDIGRLVRVSEGSVGLALKLLDGEVLPLFDELLEILKKAPELDTDRLHRLADQVGKKAQSESFDALKRLFLSHLRDKARAEARQPLAEGRLDCALQLWEKVRNIFDMADRANLDRKLALINAVAEARKAVV